MLFEVEEKDHYFMYNIFARTLFIHENNVSKVFFEKLSLLCNSHLFSNLTSTCDLL